MSQKKRLFFPIPSDKHGIKYFTVLAPPPWRFCGILRLGDHMRSKALEDPQIATKLCDYSIISVYQHRETNLVHYRKFSEQAVFLIILFYHFLIISEDSNLRVKYPKTEVYHQFFHFQLPIAEKKVCTVEVGGFSASAWNAKVEKT